MKGQKNIDVSFEEGLKRDLLLKGLIIPLIFAVVTAIACFVLSNPALNIFPDGNYDDNGSVIVTQEEYMGTGGTDNG